MEILISLFVSFIAAVAAGVTIHCICKWLDRERKGK